jgi:hypothetical protein
MSKNEKRRIVNFFIWRGFESKKVTKIFLNMNLIGVMIHE